ncbi:MAG: Rpn family recombination-promoting nuclease/putative transposase [Planctomycetaceae bacterium]|jgi:hypothetical protein|nr:Rpn family recombination-promoting nuclease/putative transposase [Planctomycetaceae bacterium]
MKNTPLQQDTQEKKENQSGNIFDIYIRQIFGQITVFSDFLLNYADPNVVNHLDLNHITPFPTHSFDRQGNERISDLIFLCALKNCDGVIGVIIVFEHAGGSVFYLPKRLLQYLVGAWNILAGNEKKKIPLPAPYFIVVRTGKKSKPQKNKPEKKQKTSDMCVPVKGLDLVTDLNFDYTEIKLPEYNLEQLLGKPTLKTALGVAKVLTEGDPNSFSQALSPIAGLEDYEEKRYMVNLSLELYAKYLRARNQKINKADLDRTLSPIFNEEEKYNMLTTIFEDKFLEGKAAGKAEGKIEGKTTAIITVLKARFGEVPPSLVELVHSYSDPIVLESWTVLAATCQSLDEFIDALQ